MKSYVLFLAIVIFSFFMLWVIFDPIDNYKSDKLCKVKGFEHGKFDPNGFVSAECWNDDSFSYGLRVSLVYGNANLLDYPELWGKSWSINSNNYPGVCTWEGKGIVPSCGTIESYTGP